MAIICVIYSSVVLKEFDEEKILGTEVGEYIQLASEKDNYETKRYYYPISRVDDFGYFDLLCKIIKDEKNQPIGKFSEFMLKSKTNDKYKITSKNYAYRYMGHGEFRFKNSDNQLETISNINDIVIIAQNTNISTFFQLIDTLSNFSNDTTSLYVLYQVENLRKAGLFDELHSLLDMGKIGLECFEESKKDQKMSFIPKECIAEYIIPSRNQLFLISGCKEFYSKLNS